MDGPLQSDGLREETVSDVSGIFSRSSIFVKNNTSASSGVPFSLINIVQLVVHVF